MSNGIYLIENSVFHNPELKIVDNDKEEKIRQLLEPFKLNKQKVEKLKQTFKEEMDLGLSADPKRQSSLLMANTFVSKLPTGREKGQFLSLDLGSTNFRVLLSKLKGSEPEDEFFVKYYDVPAEYRVGPASPLFDHIASCIDDFLITYPELRNQRLPLGFTFSYPMVQKALDVSHLITWTKSYDIPEVINKNASDFLSDSLRKKGISNVDIVAILNDTTGTQVKGAYLNQDCAIGLILGSGFNACYTEKIENVESWVDREKFRGVKEVIIDIECGALGDNGSVDFVKTDLDFELDQESMFRGSFSYEKLLAGNFLGDVIRRILLKLTRNGLLLGGHISDNMSMKDFITSTHVSYIENDNSEAKETKKLLEQLGYSDYTQDDVAIVQHVCALISQRAALLVAALLAHLLERIGRDYITIAIDGSLYKYHPKLKTLLIDFIQVLAPKHKFDLILAEDGSGKGAGLVAAVADDIKTVNALR